MYHIEKAHYIVDEMVANGAIVENNKVCIIICACWWYMLLIAPLVGCV